MEVTHALFRPVGEFQRRSESATFAGKLSCVPAKAGPATRRRAGLPRIALGRRDSLGLKYSAKAGAASAMSRDIPYRSPSDAFAATAARRPDAPFLLAPASAGLPYAPEGFRIEYGALKIEVDRLRSEYAAAGYG